MKIVGVGCGPGLLTSQAIREISEARQVYGSGRAIDLARAFIRPDAVVHEIEDYRTLRDLPAGAVVLSTGDPMLAGLGYLPGEVIPGISSLQLALARLHIPMQEVSVVVAHGRNHGRALADLHSEVERGKTVFLIADPGFDVGSCAGTLLDIPGEIAIILCEDLGYPGERIEAGTRMNPPSPRSDLFSLIIRPKGKNRG
ncbi:MAG: cobalt-precorrin-7 (C(5))-methyltransferase [Methanolinea sp.]|nr:cobalt-precorrin-7 (C(5))-methyltransferase [Methanolinea sp.]